MQLLAAAHNLYRAVHLLKSSSCLQILDHGLDNFHRNLHSKFDVLTLMLDGCVEKECSPLFVPVVDRGQRGKVFVSAQEARLVVRNDNISVL